MTEDAVVLRPGAAVGVSRAVVSSASKRTEWQVPPPATTADTGHRPLREAAAPAQSERACDRLREAHRRLADGNREIRRLLEGVEASVASLPQRSTTGSYSSPHLAYSIVAKYNNKELAAHRSPPTATPYYSARSGQSSGYSHYGDTDHNAVQPPYLSSARSHMASTETPYHDHRYHTPVPEAGSDLRNLSPCVPRSSRPRVWQSYESPAIPQSPALLPSTVSYHEETLAPTPDPGWNRLVDESNRLTNSPRRRRVPNTTSPFTTPTLKAQQPPVSYREDRAVHWSDTSRPQRKDGSPRSATPPLQSPRSSALLVESERRLRAAEEAVAKIPSSPRSATSSPNSIHAPPEAIEGDTVEHYTFIDPTHPRLGAQYSPLFAMQGCIFRIKVYEAGDDGDDDTVAVYYCPVEGEPRRISCEVLVGKESVVYNELDSRQLAAQPSTPEGKDGLGWPRLIPHSYLRRGEQVTLRITLDN